ncbi:hypothetical protein BLNAU_1729 [Blattamonas nauphoetae]|uniref:Uncharacterized protein n=1 Tax=Blattamonas nauphoetae TaxID=2049346 RepID=A0ABQ9YHF1_9EUKA|nr:hypothetical protein BLNAU_1729 [Blattamonas nauphoetae]
MKPTESHNFVRLIPMQSDNDIERKWRECENIIRQTSINWRKNCLRKTMHFEKCNRSSSKSSNLTQHIFWMVLVKSNHTILSLNLTKKNLSTSLTKPYLPRLILQPTLMTSPTPIQLHPQQTQIDSNRN